MNTEFDNVNEFSELNSCGGGSGSDSGGDWNPGNDDNVFKNRSPKFVFVTIIKDNNISVNVNSAFIKTEQCCPEEEEEHHKPGGGGGGTRPRLYLASDDSSAAVGNDVHGILENVFNHLDTAGETTKSNVKKLNSDFLKNIMKMFEDSVEY